MRAPCRCRARSAWPCCPTARNSASDTTAESFDCGSARAATTASVTSTSLSGCSRPNPIVWIGSRCRRIAAMVWRSMPPELSAPSLKSTIAPSGRDDDSASTRSSVSPIREAVAAPVELIGLLDALRLLAELIQPHLEFLAETLQQPAIEQRLRRRLARAGGVVQRHAPRIVNQHRHHVLLGLQGRDAQRRMPQQKQNERDHTGFETPDRQRDAGR